MTETRSNSEIHGKTTEEDALPAFTDIIRRGGAYMIIPFLNVKEATRFSSLCRSCRVLRLIEPINSMREFSDYNDARKYSARIWQTLPTVPNAHSILIKGEWRDQGWGNRKGMISVVAKDGKAPDDYKPWSDLVVCGKEPAPHSLAPFSLSFYPVDNMQPYNIWLRIGGGGGHSLRVRNFCVRALQYHECAS
mmetsp:Transcript_18626/g.24193  ORF Transcript_18626/g.24193 Transcript_18626/m.24193 type:complete len:192 (-) Transcript_18626:302-877(-)|eukprot:CAMPEP_0116053194 /NCGR_PEP_ID=MMETSP0322-20121206/2036_1 /TAXON_ID=163516 /ORGANISM="Leptocylindrus danicus var. apora, Strain B651" /LENGTH=191 /DNA_ID=CAMNT_0003536299 /DNA_START=85 /DNA_END=660 /DNA_ORIENTATION=+